MSAESKNSNTRDELLDAINHTLWRSPHFFDLVVGELDAEAEKSTVVEVGCGLGFDGDIPLQRKLAERVTNYIGVEPDLSVEPQPVFTQLFRTSLEDAEIADGSVDVAFSIMVMEHVADAEGFMKSVMRILKPGGVYWGFTVDKRHWYTSVAHFLSKLKLKSLYLTAVYGSRRGKDRYLDYPTTYTLSTPSDIERSVKNASSVDIWSYGPPEGAGLYVPAPFRPLINRIERRRIENGGCRTGLAVRVVK